MATKGGKRKKVQKGSGGVPRLVDFKKEIEVTKGIAKKSVWDFKGQDRRGKKVYSKMKANHRKYKAAGDTKNLRIGQNQHVKPENRRVLSCNEIDNYPS